MYRLRLLGTPIVESPAGPFTGRAVQRRRMAILALLSCTAGQRLSRDKLIAYIWPESDSETARHRLSVALHELRRAFGDSVIESFGDDVALNASVLNIDVLDFEQSLAANDWSRAVGLYRGSFLDGFFLAGAPEFEGWVESTRQRYARAYAGALEQLGEVHAMRREREQELAVLWKLAEHDPYSSAHARKLVRALVGSGDRATALRTALAYSERLQKEFGADVDAEMQQIIEELRAVPIAEVRSLVIPPERERAPSRRSWRVAAAVAAVPVVFFAARTAQLNRFERTPDVTRVAVLPFSVHGPEELRYLREGVVDLISTNLDGAGDVRSIAANALMNAVDVDASVEKQAHAARRLGATHYLTGAIAASNGELHVRAALYRIGEPDAIAHARADGAVGEVMSVIDRLTTDVIAQASRLAGSRDVRLASLTTTSLPALKAYLNGEREFRAGRFVAAIDAFTRAAQLDSTFAIANYRLALAMLWADVPDTLPFEPEARALRHAERLTLRDQGLIRGFVAWRNGDAEVAEKLYRNIVSLYPDDAEAWLQLGETLFHYNPLLGRSAAEADEAFAHAAALNPTSWEPLWHRALIAASLREWARFDDVVKQLRALDPESSQMLELDAVAAYARHDREAIAQLYPKLRKANQLQQLQIAWRIATATGDLLVAEEIVRMGVDQPRGDDKRLAYTALAALAMARNDEAQLQAILQKLSQYDPDGWTALNERVASALRPNAKTPRAKLVELRDEVVAFRSSTQGAPLAKAYNAAMISSALGDAAATKYWTDALQRLTDEPELRDRYAGTIAGLRARIHLIEGDQTSALKVLNGARNKVWFGWAVGSRLWSQAADRYLRAELLRSMGRTQEAARWYRSLDEFSIHDFAYHSAIPR